MVLFLFFASGAAGLIYEVVWSRSLSLIFGATALGVSTVLAAFMAGLALGSYWFGRVADRHKNPIRLYGFLEAGIGLYALMVPVLLKLVELAYVGYYRAVDPSFGVLSVFRFALCFLVLLVPTTLMGGTLPALSRAVAVDEAEMGRGVGSLYAVNTFGAVLGTSAAGFLLLPSIGLRATTLVAAAVNFGIALVALYGIPGRGGVPTQAANRSARVQFTGLQKVVLLAAGISGFCAFCYEVAWTRTLTLSFGGSVYAFSTMLVGFLLGIAIGSAVASVYANRFKDPLWALGAVQVLIGISAVAVSPLLGGMPAYVLEVFRRFGTGFVVLQGAQFLLCTAVMLIPTALMGAVFPIGVKALAPRREEVGESVGVLYAANTLGTILGSFCAGFLLLPTVGPQRTIQAAAFVNLLLGLGLALGSSRRRAVLVWAALGLGAAFACLQRPWSKELLASGVYFYGDAMLRGYRAKIDPLRPLSDATLLYYRDGLSGTVAVFQGNERRGFIRSLAINGKVDASDGPWDMMTQRLLAHLPLLMADRLRDVLIIGVGSGCTVGTATLYPARNIEAVEIEPGVVDASKQFFQHINRSYWKDPRVRVIVGDGRNHVMMSPRRYDCIISEPPNPWISGVSNLFTLDHYRRVKEHLAPGGVFCQWLPAYHMAPEDFKTALRTLSEVFPNLSLWASPPIYADILILATERPLRPDPELLLRRMTIPPIMKDILDMGVDGPWGLLSLCLMSGEDVVQYCADSGLHTDDRPVLEYVGPKRVRTDIGEKTVESLWRFRREVSLPLEPAVVSRDGRTTAVWFGVQMDLPGVWRTTLSDLFSVREVGPVRNGVYDVRVGRRARLSLAGSEYELTLSCARTAKEEPWAQQMLQMAGELGRPVEGIFITGHKARGVWSSQMGTAVSAVTWHCRQNRMQYMLSITWPRQMNQSGVMSTWRKVAGYVHCAPAKGSD
ncbi:MAG: fused MFS/spermidine synthase [Armatimonadota bacterium]